jgi:hypothetical protein
MRQFHSSATFEILSHGDFTRSSFLIKGIPGHPRIDDVQMGLELGKLLV